MTEDKPHVVYAKDPGRVTGFMAPSYAKAHALWLTLHTHDNPYLIATLGRVIDPSAPIIDVNE
jgi:hypothetical protein